ncbi:MAG: HtrA protease/chaperone protein / Serine protease (Protease DO) (EC [uncultured Sulfurovum sp.]|uniref:HtrA protease/chaperone protein / Serine protease (Protease DO) (EC) n=1 Tax=uncultured Sulfurovum sp. TaxID=269237 RepID=A0A6S6SFM5_9BACT|nr:MAG: HtrA protease/chaperone protein / Serine protease (Protease DO) (EC [uncultured Sulfurovum sp.]
MYKSILLSTLLSTSLFAGSITFKNAPLKPEHRLPNGKNEILSFHDVLKDSMNAVVNISTKTIVESNQANNRLFNDPFFQEFFGQRGQQKKQAPNQQDNALGSGVIVSDDGYIVTNNHVIAEADEIMVTVNGSNKEYKAKVIGRDKGSDLAVIKIEAKNLEAITFSHIEEVKLGDVVFAIGNPFGVGQTVTQGIVSALNKSHVGINKYENFIQTDASINPGNSGGALIDSRGALIGINAAILSQTGGNHGIGFTIPVDMVRNVVSKLIKDGKVSRGFMGVNISEVTPSLKKLYKQEQGAIVTDIQADSPAQEAGLQRGDLIYSVNGKKIKSPSDLQRIVTSFSPDQTIKLAIEREKETLIKKLTLSSLSGSSNILGKLTEVEGLRLSNLNKKIKKTYHINQNVEGAFIEGVLERSQADMSGFMAGDIIIQIENKSIASVEDAVEAFKLFKGNTKRVYVNREGFILLLVTK